MHADFADFIYTILKVITSPIVLVLFECESRYVTKREASERAEHQFGSVARHDNVCCQG